MSVASVGASAAAGAASAASSSKSSSVSSVGSNVGAGVASSNSSSSVASAGKSVAGGVSGTVSSSSSTSSNSGPTAVVVNTGADVSGNRGGVIATGASVVGAVTSTPSPASSNVASTGASVGAGGSSSPSISSPANSNVASSGSVAAAAAAAYTQSQPVTAPSLLALGLGVGASAASTPPTSIASGAAIAIPATGFAGGNTSALINSIAAAIPGIVGLGALASAFYLAATVPAGPSDDLLAHSLGLGVVSPAAKLPKDAGKDAGGVGEEEPAKVVPNPYGKKGGPAHQAGVEEAMSDLEKKYEGSGGVTIETEVQVVTPDGEKGSRYLDVGALAGNPQKVIEGVQVGRQTNAGIPVARERRALDDIAKAAPDVPVDFRPLNPRK